MAGLIWKKIVAKYDGRDITAQYARDGAYVRVSCSWQSGRADEAPETARRAVARGILIQMAAETKK